MVQLHAKVHAEPAGTSLDECHSAVLNIVTERSPCSEPKLFIAVINSRLDCFGGRSLGELREFVSQCTQELQSKGLVKIVDGEVTVANTTDADGEKSSKAEITNEFEDVAASPDPDKDVSWSDLRRTYADLAVERHKAPETQKQHEKHVNAPEGTADTDVLDLTDQLELSELDPASIDDHEAGAPGAIRPNANPVGEKSSAPAATTENISVVSGEEDADVFDLTDELELAHSEEASVEGYDDEADTSAATKHAVSTLIEDDAEVFDLTDELELMEAGDASTDQDQVEEGPSTRASPPGSEQGGEPTREEIIEAMRRFMSEDESDQAPEIGSTPRR